MMSKKSGTAYNTDAPGGGAACGSRGTRHRVALSVQCCHKIRTTMDTTINRLLKR